MIKEKEEFDNLLINWLVYYNSKRPHLALNLKAPLQYILNNYKMANMCLTNTDVDNIKQINEKLKDYILWYNTKKVHKGLNYITPMDFLNKNMLPYCPS